MTDVSMSDHDYVDYLVGKRPYSATARCFMPDDDLRPVEVERVRDWIWSSPRRVVGRQFFSGPHYVSIITLFIPFWEEPGDPLLYESIVVQSTRGEIVSRVATVEEARRVHAELTADWAQRLGVQLPNPESRPE